MTNRLATAARIYFDASDNASAYGKTRQEFEMACLYSAHARDLLRKALEDYESTNATNGQAESI